MRLLSQSPDCEVEFLLQFVQVPAHQVAHLDVLQVMPSALIPGIQIRGISRQGLQPHSTSGARHELLDLRPSMDRRAVPDHEQAIPRHAEQVQEELDAVQPVQRLLPHQGVDAAGGCHRPHDGEMIPGLLLTEHRSQALRGVSLDHPREEVEPRFVLENQGPMLVVGLPSQFGPDFDAPCRMVPSSRWMARLIGCCGVQQSSLRSRPTWSLW